MARNTQVDYSSPIPLQAELQLSVAHEALAQYYTFKLIEYLDDGRLMNTFNVLEQHSTSVYGAWRATSNYSLEEMRQVLITLRKRGADWPPKI